MNFCCYVDAKAATRKVRAGNVKPSSLSVVLSYTAAYRSVRGDTDDKPAARHAVAPPALLMLFNVGTVFVLDFLLQITIVGRIVTL